MYLSNQPQLRKSVLLSGLAGMIVSGPAAFSADRSAPLKATVSQTVVRTEKGSRAAERRQAGAHIERAGAVARINGGVAQSGIMPESAPGALKLKSKIVAATRSRARFLVASGQYDEAERVVRCGIAAFPANNPLVADLEQIRIARATSNVHSEDVSTIMERVDEALLAGDAGCCGRGASTGRPSAETMGPLRGL